MPTIVRVDGYRLVIYWNDHRPAHVHVIGRATEAVFRLNCPRGPIEIRENYGCSRSEVARLGRMVDRHVEALCLAWEEMHGQA